MSVSELHLVTQRNQPYGSVRRCCERCGVMTPPAAVGAVVPGFEVTDDETVYQNSDFACDKRLKSNSGDVLHASLDVAYANHARNEPDHAAHVKRLEAELATHDDAMAQLRARWADASTEADRLRRKLFQAEREIVARDCVLLGVAIQEFVQRVMWDEFDKADREANEKIDRRHAEARAAMRFDRD